MQSKGRRSGGMYSSLFPEVILPPHIYTSVETCLRKHNGKWGWSQKRLLALAKLFKMCVYIKWARFAKLEILTGKKNKQENSCIRAVSTNKHFVSFRINQTKPHQIDCSTLPHLDRCAVPSSGQGLCLCECVRVCVCACVCACVHVMLMLINLGWDSNPISDLDKPGW